MSDPAQKCNVFITSWQDSGLFPEDNYLPFVDMWRRLKEEYPERVHIVTGTFIAAKELGFCVQDCTFHELEELVWLAGQFNQQCVLVVLPDSGKCEFYYTDGNIIPIEDAIFTERLEGEGQFKDYTYMGGKYYWMKPYA